MIFLLAMYLIDDCKVQISRIAKSALQEYLIDC